MNNILSLFGWRGDVKLNVHVDFPDELTEDQKRIVESWSDDIFLSDNDEMGMMEKEERGEENREDWYNEEEIDIDNINLDIDKEMSY